MPDITLLKREYYASALGLTDIEAAKMSISDLEHLFFTNTTPERSNNVGPPNLYNSSTVTLDYRIDHLTGALVSSPTWWATDFIPIEEGESYYVKCTWYKAYYDASKVFIKGVNTGSYITGTSFIAPPNAAFVRFSSFRFVDIPNQVVFKNDFILALPSTIPSVVGTEVNIYFNAIFPYDYSEYVIDVVCASGKQYTDKWTFTPTVAGTISIAINVYNSNNVLVVSQYTDVIVKALSVGTAVTKSLVIIGDSLTDNGSSPAVKLPVVFGAGDPMDITLLGTRGSDPGWHEGRAGWSAAFYCNLSTYGGISNEFWNGSAFNFSFYKTAQGYVTVNYVIIALGVNDVFSYETDTALNSGLPIIINQFSYMVTSILAAGSKVGIALPPAPATTQTAFGKSYDSSKTRNRYLRNYNALVRQLISVFAERTSENIYIIPSNVAVDPSTSFPLVTEALNANNAATTTVQNNAVHLSSEGYGQVTDVYRCWVKSFEV